MKLTKTKIFKTKYFLLALLLAFNFSCSTEDGQDGTNGIDGTNGTNGNANVVSSDWYEPVIGDFSTSNSYRKSLPMSITNYDVNKDVLLVYYYNQNENNVSYSFVDILPNYSFDFSGENLDKSVTINIRPSFSTVYIIIESFGRDLEPKEYLWEPDPTNLDNKGVRFRYMIIPGNDTNKMSSDKNNLNPTELVIKELNQAGINTNDYEAVCDYYGIAY